MDRVDHVVPRQRPPAAAGASPADPADRLTWAAGDAAQCDLWFPPRKIPLEDGTQSVVAGAGDHRRALPVHARPDDPDAEDRGPAAGDLGAAAAAGSGPAPADLGQRARHRPRQAARRRGRRRSPARWRPRCCGCTPQTRSRRGSWSDATGSSRPRSCPAATSPHRPTSTPSSADWLTRRTARVVRTIKARPVDLLDADRAAMLPLPPVPPLVGWSNRVRLGRDYYVRVDAIDYSVDPAAIGRLVDVTADLDRVAGPTRRAAGRRPCPGLGTRHDGHRPRPRRRPRSCCAQQFQQPPAQPASPHDGWCGTWPTTTARSASSRT